MGSAVHGIWQPYNPSDEHTQVSFDMANPNTVSLQTLSLDLPRGGRGLGVVGLGDICCTTIISNSTTTTFKKTILKSKSDIYRNSIVMVVNGSGSEW